MGAYDSQLNMAIKALERRLSSLENIRGGPGISVHRQPGGVAIMAAPAAPGKRSQRDVSGDPKVLADTPATQDVDTYDRATDDKPVQFDVVTDMQYDETTHKLTYRTRTIVAVGILSVSPESDLVEVFTAEECA